MKAVLLAGGKGARLAPYTKILPKPLMPIGDMPILEILLRQLKRSGVDEAILSVGHLAELLWVFFQNGERCGLKINYSFEDTPLGTSGPLSLIADDLDDTFFVSNGDVLTTLDFTSLVNSHRQSGAIATIAMYTRKVKVDLGVLEMTEDLKLTGYIEKPTYEFPVSMGVYVFEPDVLDYIPHNEYLDFPDLVLKMIANGETVTAYPFDGYWRDLGSSSDYEAAIQEFGELKQQIIGEDPPERTNGHHFRSMAAYANSLP